MKDLKEYIIEELKTYRVIELEVPYKCQDDEDFIRFNIPKSYTEDDFMVYIQDKYLNELPGNIDNSKDLFKKNSAKIYDTLFEYDKYEKSNESGDCVEWDQSIDSKHNPDKEDFLYVKVYGLKYILKFDSFDLNVESEEEIKDTLVDIFKTYESNNANEYPIKLTLDEENIKYK